jgi:hypothetical protein
MCFGPPEYANSPLAGVEFDWLAVDRDGHVALLSTFGSAVVPGWIEVSFDAYEELPRSLWPLKRRAFAVAPPWTFHEWLAAAARGIYAYDWSADTGPYLRLARPFPPAKVDALPEPVAALARRTRFPHVCFRSSPALDVADVVACTRG